MGCWGELERIDAASNVAAREDAALRLRLGQVLEVLGRKGLCFELGFSSLAAYALERCERRSRWAEVSRCLARRLEALPQLRRAVASGWISWSMAEVLARVAEPSNEAEWIRMAQGKTLREVRRRCEKERCEGAWPADEEFESAGGGVDEAEPCRLTLTVDREESWLLEATRALLDGLGTRQVGEQVEALLAEGHGTLLASLPRGELDLGELDSADAAQARWLEQLRCWRSAAEQRCEEHVRGAIGGSRGGEESEITSQAASGCASLEGMSAAELDALVRALARASAGHELKLSRLVLALHRLDGWRRLGYATEGQYARERLGMSRSSLLARRALALRLESLSDVAAALGEARIGVEAALQVVRIATPRTELAWLARAQRRTVKHLREEVTAALIAVRLSGESDCLPPSDEELEGFHELERAVVSGRVCQTRASTEQGRERGSAQGREQQGREQQGREQQGAAGESVLEPVQRRGWRTMLQSLASWLEQGVQLSAAGSGGSRTGPDKPRQVGRVTLRLPVTRSVRAWWRVLEQRAMRWLPRGMSWLRFACESVWRSWQHLLGVDVAYYRIYIRDRHRCSSPVCSRGDVTPHHLKYRSAGGGDEDGNLTSLCTWCHLCGVHGGRIRARGSAPRIFWELGACEQPCIRVDGRDRWA